MKNLKFIYSLCSDILYVWKIGLLVLLIIKNITGIFKIPVISNLNYSNIK